MEAQLIVEFNDQDFNLGDKDKKEYLQKLLESLDEETIDEETITVTLTDEFGKSMSFQTDPYNVLGMLNKLAYTKSLTKIFYDTGSSLGVLV